jgi:hypothetical protein
MKYELKRIGPLRAANVGALVYGLLTGALMLILLPLIVVLAFIAGRNGPVWEDPCSSS